jgi:hypothetical protein
MGKDTVYFRETRSRTPCALSGAKQPAVFEGMDREKYHDKNANQY